MKAKVRQCRGALSSSGAPQPAQGISAGRDAEGQAYPHPWLALRLSLASQALHLIGGLMESRTGRAPGQRVSVAMAATGQGACVAHHGCRLSAQPSHWGLTLLPTLRHLHAGRTDSAKSNGAGRLRAPARPQAHPRHSRGPSGRMHLHQRGSGTGVHRVRSLHLVALVWRRHGDAQQHRAHPRAGARILCCHQRAPTPSSAPTSVTARNNTRASDRRAPQSPQTVDRERCIYARVSRRCGSRCAARRCTSMAQRQGRPAKRGHGQ